MISKVIQRSNNRERRRARIRDKVRGSAALPRLSVFRSNKYIYGQIIDDQVGRTLVSTSVEAKTLHKGTRKLLAAKKCGEELAKKAAKAKITGVVFDRGGYRFAGRVASFAQGARAGGLKF